MKIYPVVEVEELVIIGELAMLLDIILFEKLFEVL